MDFKKVGFIGFGLIGGSIARGLKKEQPEITLVAYNYYENRENPRLNLAKEEGTLDAIYTDLKELASCQLLFLCAPVRSNIAYLTRLKEFLPKDCILTDVGSEKGSIHEAVRKLDMEENFIGGHPMTGSEKTGYDHSRPDLLHQTCYILTPTQKTPEKTVSQMEELVQMLGANPILLDADSHDNITAAISHVPHILSSALVHMVKGQKEEEKMCRLVAGSFRDMSRVAASSPVMWQDICLTNTESILACLKLYKEKLALFEKALETKDSQALLSLFTEGKEYRDAIYHNKKQ